MSDYVLCLAAAVRLAATAATHQDESPAEYSLAGCSPAEPASASSASLILNYNPSAGQEFSANGNRPRNALSQVAAQSTP